MTERIVRTTNQIRAEIEQTFGFLPPFFEPAGATPQVLENLWQQTLSAYIDNPLSAVFKERLNASLSRFCAIPYCMVCHSSALRPLGMTAQQVLTLLDAPFLNGEDDQLLGSLPVPRPEEAAAPVPESLLEKVLLYCATVVFLEQPGAARCQMELRRLLEPDLYPHFVAYLAYIKTCHTWIEAHPEVSYEADRRAQEHLGPLLSEEPALAEFFRQYQAKMMVHRLHASERNSAEALRTAQADTARLLESISDAFFALSADWRFTYVNDQAEALLQRTRADLLGKIIWDEFPEAIGSPFEGEYRRAVADGKTVTFEQFFPPLSAWFDVRAYPSPDGLSVFFQNMTERVERRQRERFLADLAERARALTDPDAVIADALRSVGEFMGVARCVFVDIDIVSDVCTCHPDYRAADTVASMEGTSPISAFGAVVVAAYGAGHAVTVDDVRSDPDQVPSENVAAYEALGIRAHVGVPVVHSSRLVSCIGAHSAVPRHWTPEEVALLQAVVERTWLTVEVLRQQRALMRETKALSQSEERYRLLVEGAQDYAMILMDLEGLVTSWNAGAERILGWSEAEVLGRNGDLLFTPEDRSDGVPVRELARAAAKGKSLDLRWHVKKDGSLFFADGVMEGLRDENGNLRGFAKILRDATDRKKLEDERTRLLDANRLLLDSTGDGIYGIDTAGRFTFLNRAATQMLGFTTEQVLGKSGHGLIHHTRPDGTPYPEDECLIYQALRLCESVHVEDDVFWRADGTSFPVAYTASPIIENDTVRGAVVTFADIRERKALERERERLSERERNIATQLQTALTPSIPDRIPGMALAKYYEAALDEAGVGGDFYDVFPLDKGCTVLAVGDLSGKGLIAARQVATVRNMLRYALHRAPTLADGIDGLNEILVEQALLTGFATLFVGCYDNMMGTLTYVNAGQEPALLRRAATGQIEELSSTGSIIGAIGSSLYVEQTVALSAGDALAIFTDGVTECGASRREMLGIDGVTALLRAPCAPETARSAAQTAETLALRLVDGVDVASLGGVAKDDVCILVAVVEDAFPGP